MWNVFVFAVIGVFIGGAARLLYPGRQSLHVLGTMLVGLIGAVAGGMFSWIWWPDVEGEFHTGNLTFSLLGGIAVIAIWAGVSYQRRLRA